MKTSIGKALEARFKKIRGEVRHPKIQDFTQAALARLESNYPPRLLGHTAESTPVFLLEEERESHAHILGAPGQGKSCLA